MSDLTKMIVDHISSGRSIWLTKENGDGYKIAGTVQEIQSQGDWIMCTDSNKKIIFINLNLYTSVKLD